MAVAFRFPKWNIAMSATRRHSQRGLPTTAAVALCFERESLLTTASWPITDPQRKLLAAYAKPIRVRNMDLSEFTANYSQLGDDQLLCLWADRNALVPEAAIALGSEIQRSNT